MGRIGTVLETHGEFAVIETTRRGVCDGCSDHATCALEGVASTGLAETIRVRNPIHADPGDRVAFELTGRTELTLSLLIWTVPLVGVIAGAILGTSLHEPLSWNRDVATLVGVVAGGAAAFGVVIAVDRRSRGDACLVPEIVKVVEPAECVMTAGTKESTG